MRGAVLIAQLGLAAAGTLNPRVLLKQTIDLTEHPLAVCNDGTPGVYYYDPAPAGSTQSNIWIVYLQDGGWCWNKEICDARVRAETQSISSASWGPTYNFALGSILNVGDAHNFGDANVIYVRYCSSDAHIGDRAAEVPFSTVGGTQSNIHFRGRRITKAVISNLVSVHGMSTSTPQTVVLAGSSAGGRGVLHNLNHMKTDMASYGWNFVTSYGIIDSGLYTTMNTIDWTKTDLNTQAQNIVTYTHADIDPICSQWMIDNAAANGWPTGNAGGVPANNWRCLFGEYAIKTLVVPHVLHQFQYDAWGTYVNLPIPYGWATTELLTLNPAWNHTMRIQQDNYNRVFQDMPNAAQVALGGTRAVHSSGCYQHMNLQTSFFKDKYKVNGISLADVVNNFIFGGTGPTYAVENCVGWECGADCDYTRTGSGSPDVCGWWYWFTALRSMSPTCQQSLVNYHTAGYFEWPMDEACPCLLALPADLVAQHQCPHLFAYGYSPGVPAPAYPGLFPNRPTQQNYQDTGAPITLAQLGTNCQAWSPTPNTWSSTNGRTNAVSAGMCAASAGPPGPPGTPGTPGAPGAPGAPGDSCSGSRRASVAEEKNSNVAWGVGMGLFFLTLITVGALIFNGNIILAKKGNQMASFPSYPASVAVESSRADGRWT